MRLELRSNPELNLWLDLKLDDISVRVASETTSILKSPVIAPVDADAESPLASSLRLTFLASNKSLFCKEAAELLRVSSWLFRTPKSETFARFSFFSLSSLWEWLPIPKVFQRLVANPFLMLDQSVLGQTHYYLNREERIPFSVLLFIEMCTHAGKQYLCH